MVYHYVIYPCESVFLFGAKYFVLQYMQFNFSVHWPGVQARYLTKTMFCQYHLSMAWIAFKLPGGLWGEHAEIDPIHLRSGWCSLQSNEQITLKSTWYIEVHGDILYKTMSRSGWNRHDTLTFRLMYFTKRWADQAEIDVMHWSSWWYCLQSCLREWNHNMFLIRLFEWVCSSIWNLNTSSLIKHLFQYAMNIQAVE